MGEPPAILKTGTGTTRRIAEEPETAVMTVTTIGMVSIAMVTVTTATATRAVTAIVTATIIVTVTVVATMNVSMIAAEIVTTVVTIDTKSGCPTNKKAGGNGIAEAKAMTGAAMGAAIGAATAGPSGTVKAAETVQGTEIKAAVMRGEASCLIGSGILEMGFTKAVWTVPGSLSRRMNKRRPTPLRSSQPATAAQWPPGTAHRGTTVVANLRGGRPQRMPGMAPTENASTSST